MLDGGGGDVANFLEDLLVVPVGIQAAEFGGDSIVVANVERVQHGQMYLLVDALVARDETEQVLGTGDAVAIGILRLSGQQGLEAVVPEAVPHSHQSCKVEYRVN